jgi:nucleotide-binding universal stress UspA family protein
MLQDILVPLGGGEHDRARLQVAAGLAEVLAPAKVSAVLAQAAAADSMVWSPDGFLGGYPVEVMNALEQGLQVALKETETLCASFPSVAFEHLRGQPDLTLGERAALADLVVLDCASARGKGLMAPLFEHLLLTVRAPLLVQRRPVATLTGRAVVAYDGGPPSARAVRAAMPLLGLMEKVLVVQSPDAVPERRKPFSGPERVVARIGASGGTAEHAVFDGGSNVAAELVALCADFGADLLVCGAYGHSRLGELVLGGTSKDLLANAASPSLFIHH